MSRACVFKRQKTIQEEKGEGSQKAEAFQWAEIDENIELVN